MIQTRKDVLRFEVELNEMKRKISYLTEADFNALIQESWDQLKKIVSEERLKTMPVDTISTLGRGMPINRLVAAGFETIYDIRNETMEDLMTIEGVGEIISDAIYKAVLKIKAAVFKEAVPKINPDDLSEEENALLENIYTKWKVLTSVQSLRENIEVFNRQIEGLLQVAQNKKGFLGSIFQSKHEKEEIRRAIETLNAPNNKESLYKLKEQLSGILQFRVDRDALRQHFIEKNAAYYTEIEKIVGFDPTHIADDLPSEIVDTINDFPLSTAGLKVELRHYQTFGAKYALHYKRTLLGDEMGLGKTIQALALINHLFQNGLKYLIVVCPLSVLANWNREIEQHSNLKAFVFHGNNRDLEFAKWQEEKGVLLTTYEHTLRLEMDGQQVDALIVDEAHYIKNPEARRSKSVYELSNIAHYALFMSGTPIENRLEEMKQLIAVLQPEIADLLSTELHLLQPTEFKKTVAPVYLRRNRKDVLAELPELEVIPQWMDFGEEEQIHYEQAVANGKLMLMRRSA